VVTAVRAFGRLNDKADAIADLPLWRALDATVARVAATNARLADASAITDRMLAALALVQGSLANLRATFAAALVPFGLAVADVRAIGVAFGSRSSRRRTPES
jgi:hypothetical protein